MAPATGRRLNRQSAKSAKKIFFWFGSRNVAGRSPIRTNKQIRLSLGALGALAVGHSALALGALRGRTVTLLFALALSACPSRPREDVKPSPTASVPPVPASAPSPKPSAKPAPSPLPERFGGLGGPCPEKNDHELTFCHDGRVTGIWAMVDTVHGVPPAGAEIIREEPRREFAPGRSLTVALEGDRLWIKLISCGACRRVMGWSFVGDLSKLSDKQLSVAQARIGLPETLPPLRTPKAWRDAYRNRPLPPLPDGAMPMPDGG